MSSPSTTVPKIQCGLFAPPSAVVGIKWQRAGLVRQIPLINTTGTAAGVQDKAKTFTQGTPTRIIAASGIIVTTGEGGGQAMASLGSINAGTIDMQFNQWSLSKQWPLVDITGPNEGSREWVYQMPVVSFSAKGVATGSGGPAHDTDEETTFTVAINQFGSLAPSSGSSFKLTYFQLQGNLSDGGPVPCSISGYFSGQVTHTGKFTWLFPGYSACGTDAPVRGDTSLTTDGEVIAFPALAHSFVFTNPAGNGGPVSVSAQFREDATEEGSD
jgi:hypothetical protein